MKKAPAKGKRPPKKGLRSRMPEKRSINLVLVDENKISPAKAIPAILLIIVLAAAFSKFLVADRLVAMSQAASRASGLKTTLTQATEALHQYDGIEDTFAHLTYAGMTQEELNRVDRVKVLELVETILPEGDATKSWSVSENILTVEITGSSLQSLNELARKIEESPIVDTCVIATAKKDEQKTPNQTAVNITPANQTLAGALESRRQAIESSAIYHVVTAITGGLKLLPSEAVQARFTIYLQQPTETEDAATAEASEESQAAQAGAQDAEAPHRAGNKPNRSNRASQPAEAPETAAEVVQDAQAAFDDAAEAAIEEAFQVSEEVVADAASEPGEVDAP